MCEKIKHFK